MFISVGQNGSVTAKASSGEEFITAAVANKN